MKNKSFAVGVINEKLACHLNVVCQSPVTISNHTFNVGAVEVEEPHFDELDPITQHLVLVQVIAFSCNYRDKAIILGHAEKAKSDDADHAPSFFWFGSDFVAKVIKVGTCVTRFKVGDRVIPNCCFPESPGGEAAGGVTTNDASRGFLILHHEKLSKINDNMPSELAAELVWISWTAGDPKWLISVR